MLLLFLFTCKAFFFLFRSALIFRFGSRLLLCFFKFPLLQLFVRKRWRYHSLQLKQLAFLRAHVQDRSGPFLPKLLLEKRLSGFAHGGIHRIALRHRAVKLQGEHFCGRITDLKLHGDHGGHALLQETLGHARKRILPGTARSFAGVQHRQPQRAVIVELHAQHFAANGIGHP